MNIVLLNASQFQHNPNFPIIFQNVYMRRDSAGGPVGWSEAACLITP
ncbi:MAG: hypothetical protein V2J55_05360 [Candidatus Competibacteraceae bacterium]|jgi:hypothetical protein|nr:hypothetical protein [Candidatus Competibacteraceae bacterium]